ncbi:MAG: M16 family metallopeptidase [Cytophagales bacterium]
MLNRKKKPNTPFLPVFSPYLAAVTQPDFYITVVKNVSPFITLCISQHTFKFNSPPGFDDILADMLPKSRVLKGKRTLAAHVEHYGARLGVHVFQGGISIELLVRPDDLPDLLGPLVSTLRNPDFTQADLESTKKEFKARLLQEKELPRLLAKKNLWGNIFGHEHPYGRQTKLAEVDLIMADLLRHYCVQVWQTPNLFISGPVSTAILKQIEKNFPVPSPLLDRSIPLLGPGLAEQTIPKPSIAQAFIAMGHLTIGFQHPDSVALYITNKLLGGFFGARLMCNIREKKGYTYDIRSVITPCQEHAVWFLATSVKKTSAEATLEAIQVEIKDLQQRLVSIKELELLKNYLIGNLLADFDDPLTFGDRLHFATLHGMDIAFYDRLYEGIQTITPPIIQRIAQQYLGAPTCHRVIVQ